MKDKVLKEVEKRRTLRLKQLEQVERQRKNLEERLGRLASLNHELAEAKRLLAENEKLGVQLRRQQIEERRKKPGAKWKWKGELGYHLICAVKALTADGTSDAQAFRDLHLWAKRRRSSRKATRRIDEQARTRFEQSVGEHWQYLQGECCEQGPRQLAARHCDALKAWGPYFEQDDDLDAEMERFRAISAANEE